MGVFDLFLLAALVLICEGTTKTVLTFSRKINTCDSEDRPLQNATSKIIWSYNDNDPVNPDTILYHQKRGVTSVRFLAPSTTEPELPADVQHFDILENSTINFANSRHGPTTQYWCSSHKIMFTEKEHIVRVEPMIDPRFTQQIHHLLLYQCADGLDEDSLNYKGGCYAINMPGAVYKCNGDKMIHVWAVGGGAYDYPIDVGLPMGPGPSYFVLQVHIENPTLVPMTAEMSGVRFYTTKTLRTYDAGVGMIGATTDPLITIPPFQSDYMLDGITPAQCTQLMYPDGIKILAAALHTHIAGRQIYWWHFRDGEELNPLVEEPYYDFNYQDYVVFDPPVNILPGDEMRLECHYDTSGRSVPTPMGLSTEEEMCLSYFIYYPAVQYQTAGSANYTFLGGNNTAKCAGQTFYDVDLLPYTPYVQPPCDRVTADPARQTPVLRNEKVDLNAYERNQYLDEEKKYKLYWTINKTDLSLKAAVEVETTGWIGLGISTNGMEGADVLIGWVKDGAVYFADRFATQKAMPPVDASQDYYDISGGEYTETAASSQTWIEGLSRPAIALFFTFIGALMVLIGVFIYSRYRKRKAKSEYYALDEEGRTKETVMLDNH